LTGPQLSPAVISASRRTDIPAHYIEWFLNGLRLGSFSLYNPYNGTERRIPVSRETVHSIVFWSKNYGPLLDCLDEFSGWSLAFNFTLNCPDPLLEPALPPLRERLEQMKRLVNQFGPEAVRWRHDPVVFYELDGRVRDNLGEFEMLLDFAAGIQLDSCTVSFMDHYRKIDRRTRSKPGLHFIYPDEARMFDTAAWMAERASCRGIRILTCCESALSVAGIDNLSAGACIDHRRLTGLFGGTLTEKPDKGQRRDSACLCHESMDIGSYSGQPCRCGCLYCYANPIV
jgi:hypothetical protein